MVDSSAVANALPIVELVAGQHYLAAVVAAPVVVVLVVVVALQAFVVSFVAGLSPVANNTGRYI